MKLNLEITKQGLKPKAMSIYTILACFNGQSVFSLAKGDLLLLYKVLEFF